MTEAIAAAPTETQDETVEAAAGPAVRFEVSGKVLDLSKVNRMARRLLEGQAKKFQKKYADVKGPNGETPTIVIRSPRLMDPKVEIVLEYPESMKDAIQGHEKAVRIA